MKRVAVLLIVFVALVLCIVGSMISTFSIWMIKSSAELIAYAKDIEI